VSKVGVTEIPWNLKASSSTLMGESKNERVEEGSCRCRSRLRPADETERRKEGVLRPEKQGCPAESPVSQSSQPKPSNKKGEGNMTRKRTIALISIMLFAGLALAVVLSVQGKPASQNARCRPSGVYLFPFETGEMTQVTFIPNDPSANELTVITRYAESDPTGLGLFPDATSVLKDMGRAVRTGKNTYEVTTINYPTKWGDAFIGKPVGIWVSCGELIFSDDCETVRLIATFAAFSLAKDGDGDGLPDEGEDPDFCVGNDVIGKRVPIIPPYAPTIP
jgi:hypothetical protein